MANANRRDDSQVQRQCAVTRISRPVAALIRFVADPDGGVVPDLKRALPGRGVSVTCARDVIETAVRKGVFARALKRSVRVDESLPAQVEALLVQAALGRLALANKAGQVVAGFVKVEAAIAKGSVAGLVHAAEAAADGRRKLDGAFARPSGGHAGAPVLICFSAEQLSLALGRANVIHAAVTGSGAGAQFLAAAARLERYRAGSAAYAAA